MRKVEKGVRKNEIEGMLVEGGSGGVSEGGGQKEDRGRTKEVGGELRKEGG